MRSPYSNHVVAQNETYENLALNRRSCIIRSPYSNHVAVQWDVHGNLVLPHINSALWQQSAWYFEVDFMMIRSP